jgi:acyl-homoserine lactone acylase PvdQ
MIDILKDVKDVYAEDKKRSLLRITRKFISDNNQYNTVQVHKVLALIQNWNAEFKIDMTEPVYFTLWEYFFRKNFLSEQFFDKPNVKMIALSVTFFESRYTKMFREIADDNMLYGKQDLHNIQLNIAQDTMERRPIHVLK